jgi:hypothetical protein
VGRRRKGTVIFNLIENKAGTNEVNVEAIDIACVD